MRVPEMSFMRRARMALTRIEPGALALARLRCPFCGPSLALRMNRSDHGVRCLRCAASSIHLAMGAVLLEELPDLTDRDAYELSARGPLVAFLRRKVRSLQVSEFLPEVPFGHEKDSIRSEDVQQLTFADETFDLITHTEVLEHVPDDRSALAELHRVLRAGGVLVFSVPLHEGEGTIERARLRDGRIEHLLPAVLHGDPLRGGAGILAFRDYGGDIVERVRAAGFVRVELRAPRMAPSWLKLRKVIIAHKDAQ